MSREFSNNIPVDKVSEPDDMYKDKYLDFLALARKEGGDSSAYYQYILDQKRYSLMSAVSAGIDKLSPEDRELLRQFGYYFAEVKNNYYEAASIFQVLNDFEALRRLADKLQENQHSPYELQRILVLLEDHEALRDLLNNEIQSDDDFRSGSAISGPAFHSLHHKTEQYINKFLETNNTPVATGHFNGGADIVAIHNLAKQFDVAVPIARGGLIQGALAHLWGMPTRTVDIAAHNRKTARGKWIDTPSENDFKDKRVLLFDKDAVTGASIKKTVKMLAPYQPGDLGVYFTHNVIKAGSGSLGTLIDDLPSDLEIFYPKNAPLQEAGDIYIEAHEKLETQYGRRRILERLFSDEAERLRGQYPELASSLKNFMLAQVQNFDTLNQNLPGVSEVRERILLMLNNIYKEHQERVNGDFYNLPNVRINFQQLLDATHGLPLDFDETLIRARYQNRIDEASKKRDVENPHLPNDPIGAFEAACTAVKDGFDVALIVGPEGFAYEPYFQDLGLATVAVNIPESGEDEARTIKLFDDLTALVDKKVLVVEDDVHTGATLKKIIEQFGSHAPAQLGLYLGQPEVFQRTTNIPTEFTKVYMAETNKKLDSSPSQATQNFRDYLETKGLRIFKN